MLARHCGWAWSELCNNGRADRAIVGSNVAGETSTRASGTFSYGYDGGTAGGPGYPTSFKGTANAFNSDNQNTSSGSVYDGNGSPNSYKSKTLTFDPEQRLTSYGGTTQTDSYDGNGLRTWKQNASGKTFFLYDGSQLVAEYLSGTLTATNTFGVDGLVSRHSASGSVFYTFDERGNVSQRTSSTGSVLSSDVYDAYGTRTSTGGADVFGYGAQAGYYTDSETGLVLCTHRFYDPSTGRWLTRDPISYRGGVNLYGYVGNDPGNRVDPSGFASESANPIDWDGDDWTDIANSTDTWGNNEIWRDYHVRWWTWRL
jgi:RHS repeat-associated protein